MAQPIPGRLMVKNWDQFQHYKNRRPPWIKLHRSTLDDLHFSRLPIASKALAPLIWLLASETKEGSVVASTAEIAFRLRMPEGVVGPALQTLIDAGFLIGCLQDASSVLAPRLQDAIPEGEGETEKDLSNFADANSTGLILMAQDDQPPKKKRGRPKKETDPAVGRLVGFYADEYLRVRGLKPSFSGPQTGKMFKDFLRLETEDTIRATVTLFFEEPPHWNEDNAAFNPEHFYRAFNQLRERLKNND